MNKLNITILSLIATMIISSCGKKVENKQTEVVTPKIKTEKVSVRKVAQTQEYTATVEAETKNNIFPVAPSRINKIYVEVGDKVIKNQLLVQMDDSNLKQAKLQLDNQQLEFSRIEELYKVGGISKSDWEAAKTMLDVKQTAYRHILDNTSLRSPINGIITARNYDNGDMCSAANPILVVEQIAPVKMKINVSESYYSKIKKGDNVDVALDVYKDEIFKGKVTLLYPTINPKTRTFTAEVSIDNKDLKIKPGMFARVIVNYGEIDRVLVSDKSVVKQAGTGDRYIYTYSNGTVEYKKVELGKRIDNQYEIISGIEPEEEVVVAGQSKLVSGAKVEVER